ncbi:four-carbon acid sugar kinase family protein [Herbiconiux sp. CPCC 203407]|uniref:3-oxo-tetronate kinase n=1 Tax=Herbiconiux oxytropis TaxID=2970915 RepID=A0AA42BSU0_9MICO|nr:3-oxo-tetronate kinase [Herbiconiux oxytropis]MCS5721444.1 four-carbon acid sugar kinase family protein [Herbiconiux oxytropis]MCS5724521.1 four-carbon acid sugar kinase family protein [Herbiconiux oxytropis]
MNDTGLNARPAPWLGVIADDVTGATDLAGYVARSGSTTIQFFGVPNARTAIPADVDCVIVALKSRSTPPEEAVADSLAAHDWLASIGVERIYVKYCSTFDSTDRGNIGPVLDALAERTGEREVIVCPSAPENGRTVYQGKLFVWGQTLDESPLREHPVNPMRDADLRRLLVAQSRESVGLVPWQVVAGGGTAVAEALATEASAGRRHVVVDALDDADLDSIAEVALTHRLATGSAGLAAAMARKVGLARSGPAPFVVPSGDAVVLSGSCSAATRRQVELFRAQNPSFELDPIRLAEGSQFVDDAVSFVEASPAGSAPLVYSTADPEQVAHAQDVLGVQRAASIVEDALGEVASRLRASGRRHFVIAGGETSGAVVHALGVDSIVIGPEIAPGVPLTVSAGDHPVALVLKSGNFGGERFFTEALGRLRDLTPTPAPMGGTPS